MEPSAPGPIDKTVGRRIRTLRESAALRLIDLAEYLCITPQQLQKYETGQNGIGAARLYLISRLFGVSAAWFFLEEEPKPMAPDLTRYHEWQLIRTYLAMPPAVRVVFLGTVTGLADALEP
jgi:transcriptional regulator with XRE-family HTH domain